MYVTTRLIPMGSANESFETGAASEVAQISKSAVSRVSKPACGGLPTSVCLELVACFCKRGQLPIRRPRRG